MARYKESVCRLCRREGVKLFLKGDRCYSDKCGVARKPYPPGEHKKGHRKVSEYGLQLREKQKARRIYGVLERQFRRYFTEASRHGGVTGEKLLQILESRLDNIIYRMGFARSRPEARQLVKHGHFQVDGRKVDIPSYLTKPGQIISVKEKSRSLPIFKELAETKSQEVNVDWLEVDYENLSGKIIRIPEREEIDVPIAEHLIVELCSR